MLRGPLTSAWRQAAHRPHHLIVRPSSCSALSPGDLAFFGPCSIQQQNGSNPGQRTKAISHVVSKDSPGSLAPLDTQHRKAAGPRSTTLEHFTLSLAPQQRARPALTIEQLIDQYDPSIMHSSAQLPREPSELNRLLKHRLRRYRLSEKDWLSMLSAVTARTWPEVRSYMYAMSTADWPSFVLNHALRCVSTPSEALDALAAVASKVATAKPHRLKGFLAILTEKVLYELPALHLTSRLTDLFLQIAGRQPRKDRRTTDSLRWCCLFLAKHLARHGEQAARDNALRLLQWAEENDDQMSEQLYPVFFRVDRSPPAFFSSVSDAPRTADLSLQKAFDSSTFLSCDLAQELISTCRTADGRLLQRFLRSAVLSAGRDRNFAQARAWYDELCTLAHRSGDAHDLSQTADDTHSTMTDLQIYMRAMLRAEHHDGSTSHNLKQLQSLLETDSDGRLDQTNSRSWETMLAFISSDADVPPERVLAMLAVRLEDDIHPLHGRTGHQPVRQAGGVDAMLKAAMKLADQLGRTQRSYTIVMDGLLRRKQPREAVAVWHAMLQRGVTPTRATLSVLLRALFTLGESKKAVKQIQQWCELGVEMPVVPPPIRAPLVLPRSSLDGPIEVHLDLPSATAEASGDSASTLRRCVLRPDTILATMVFEGLWRTHATDTAYTVWAAMQQTLAVAPDAPILAILLKCASGQGDLPSQSESEMAFSPYLGISIFRRILLLQHPELKECLIGPMLSGHDHGNGGAGLRGVGESWLLRGEFGMRTVERWMSDRVARFIGGRAPPPKIPFTSPSSDGGEKLDFTVTFTPELFDHYLRLLHYIQLKPLKSFFRFGGGNSEAADRARSDGDDLGRIEELFLLLAWMRALDVRPLRRTLATICLELEEVLPPLSSLPTTPSPSDGDERPADRVPLRENAGLLADWLESWMDETRGRGSRSGDKILWPTDRDMQIAYKWKMERLRAVELGESETWEERRRWFTFRPSLQEEREWKRRQEEREALGYH